MANETHSLKIGSTTYNLYGTGVKTLIGNSAVSSSFPIAVTNNIGTTSGTYNNLYTVNNNDLIYSPNDIIQASDNYTLSNYTFAKDETMTTDTTSFSGTCFAAPTSSPVTLPSIYNSVELLKNKKLYPNNTIIVPSILFYNSIVYARATSSSGGTTTYNNRGPQSYTLGTCYALIYIKDSDGNILKTSSVSLSNSITSSSTISGLVLYNGSLKNRTDNRSVIKSYKIPELVYKNTTSQTKTISVIFVPYYSKSTFGSGSYGCVLSGNILSYNNVNIICSFW